MTSCDIAVSMSDETASDLRALVTAEVSRLRMECASLPKSNPARGYLRGVLNRLSAVEVALRIELEPETDESES